MLSNEWDIRGFGEMIKLTMGFTRPTRQQSSNFFTFAITALPSNTTYPPHL